MCTYKVSTVVCTTGPNAANYCLQVYVFSPLKDLEVSGQTRQCSDLSICMYIQVHEASVCSRVVIYSEGGMDCTDIVAKCGRWQGIYLSRDGKTT